MKGFYFGAYIRPGVMDVTVDFHNINRGVNQPALRSIFRRKAVLSILVTLPFDNRRHTDFVAYVAGPSRHRGPGVSGDGSGYEVIVFRRRRGSDELVSVDDEDVNDHDILGMILLE